MLDRDYIEEDLQNSSLKGEVTPIRTRKEIMKSNKLANGYFEKFLPSYIETFTIESNNNIKSFRDYYKVKVSLTEISEYIEIFVGDAMSDLDKNILQTNLKSMIMLAEARIKQVEVKLGRGKE